MKTLKELQDFFAQDVYATQSGMVVEQSNSEGVVCAVHLNDSHKNAVGRVQGGLIYTLADFAFAVLANREQMGTVTLSSTINYLASPKGGRLTAHATCLREGRSVCYCQIHIRDNVDTLVAVVLTTGFRK